jgi:hypothetical protein
LILYLLLFPKKEKKKKEETTRGLFPGQTHPSGCAALGFSQLLRVIKNCFKGQSLNFMYTLYVGSYLVG